MRIKFCAGLGRPGDDQWRTSFIDEDGIDLINHREIQFALRLVLSRKREIVTQVVKTELIVRRIRNVARIGITFFFLGLAAFGYADGQAKKFVDRSHPVGVALRQVFVNRDDMHAIATQRIQIGRQCRNQRLALTSPHLGDVAVVQNHAANQLHIERAHAHCAH